MLITELCSLGGPQTERGSVPEERQLTDFNLDLTTGASTPHGRKFTYSNLGERGYFIPGIVGRGYSVCGLV